MDMDLLNNDKCDVTCQKQAFVPETSCRVMVLLRKNMILAFISF